MSLLSFAKKAVTGSKKKTPEKSVAKPQAKREKQEFKQFTEVELRPHVSEASFKQQADNNVYCFKVRPEVSKRAILSAVREQFSVDPVSIKTANWRGKARRRGATHGATNNWKKAWVKLPQGKTIDFTT